MAIGLLPEKVICDMQECISKLGEEFKDTRIPINDDNTDLHRFCSKLEFLLQNGLKDHGNLLRKRREYWDYFCHCLGSSRGKVHDGLKFVKSHPELKTSLARGRGFIRFCLMRQCLADTLQCCFVNEKVSSAFYYERSILRQESQVSILLSSLYELNDVQFDLSPRGYDLDVSWPTFARKMFDSSHLWQPPSRSMSISSLSSCVSQNDSVTAQPYSSNAPNIKEIDELRLEIERLENKMEELQQQLHRSEQQEEHSRLLADEREQQLLCLSKQLEAEQNLHKTGNHDIEENSTKPQKEWQEEKVGLTDKLNMYIETSKEHTKRINQISSEYESKDNDFKELQAKVIKLEEENGTILNHSLQLEIDLKKNQEHLETQKAMSDKLEETVSQLKIENEALQNQVKKELVNTQIQSDEAMVETCKELTEKLQASEASLLSITAEKERLNLNLSKVEQINKILEKIVGTLEKENAKLRQHLTIVEENLNRTQAAFEKSQAANADLENKISEVRTELQNALDNSIKTVNELQMAKNFPMELITAMENVMQPSNSDSLEVMERLCCSNIVDTELRDKINSFIQILTQNVLFVQMAKNFPMELITAMENVMQSSNSDSLEVIERLYCSDVVDTELRDKINSFVQILTQNVLFVQMAKNLPMELITSMENVMQPSNSDSLEVIERLCCSNIVDTELRDKINSFVQILTQNVSFVQMAKNFPMELITAMENVMKSSNSDSLEVIERLCCSDIVDTELRNKINSFVQILTQRANQQTTNNAFEILQQCRPTNDLSSSPYTVHDNMTDLYQKQAITISELQKELDGCLQETLKLSCQMCILKDMLHLDSEKVNISPLSECDIVENNTETSECDSSIDGIPNASSAENICLDELNNNDTKLNKLVLKTHKLCHNLETFRHLNHCLIAKVQEQERKLSGIAQELEATQKLVSSLKLEHNKLQTSEAITRYELKEKRKLLTRLRTQLESTREDWHRMRKSYSDSEAEWQSLRDEFAKRHKQASEESGFIDCNKNFEDSEAVDGGIEIPTTSSPIDISESSPHDDSMLTDCSAQLSSSCEGAEGVTVEETKECEDARPKTRLALLEEQCQSLYQSLVNSASKSDNLEQRVQSLVLTSSRTHHHDIPLQQVVSDNLSAEQLALDNNTSDNDDTLLDHICSTEIEQVSLPLDSSLPLNNLNELSNETIDNITDESNLPGVGEYSDLNSSTDDEYNAVHEDQEEDMHCLRRQALHSFVHRFQNQRVQHESREADLNSKVEILQKTNFKLEKEVEKLKQERNELIAREGDFRKRTEYIFRKERQNFNVQLEDFETERSNLQRNFEKLTLELKEASDKIGPLEKSLQETMDELNKMKQIKDDEVSALQFQLSTESLKCERALKLDELQLSLSTRDEECTKLNDDLKKIVMELDQEKRVSDQVKAEIQETKEQNEKMILQHNSELLEMKSDNANLKKNLIKLTREKDKLWKHSEKLSHHQKIQVTDRWMEDSETNSCLGCKSEFSFTVRKHHCRLCGRIFCHSCSNNWLLIAASKKQARVCKECFLQHIELQTEVTRTCSITNVADSEDESEGGIPIASPSTSQLTLSPSSSAEPENRSPMSSSSLPVSSPEISAVLESDSIPMYGSVPDLPSFCASRRCSHDYRLTQETKQSLNKQAGVSQATPFDEFDVISDEEIAHSLSSYNPYIQTVNSGRKTDSRLHTTITRTAANIASAGLTGVKGELWVNAGTQYGIPVVCDETSVLHWEFSTEPQRIAFSVAYKKSNTSTYDKFEMQPLLHTTHVSSSQHCVKGHVIMKNPGIYVLIFDNRFSRISAKKVKYLLLVNSIEECDVRTCKENVEH